MHVTVTEGWLLFQRVIEEEKMKVATYSDNFLANEFAFQISRCVGFVCIVCHWYVKTTAVIKSWGKKTFSAKVTKGITCVINVMSIHIESEKTYHPF